MRVIAGSRRSLPLKTVPGLQTRPTTDRIKETLFNILSPWIPGCRFLDLFAGSGGIGIEALSRGAAFAAFIEKDPQAVRVIRENLAFTRFTEASQLVRADVKKALELPNRQQPYDVVFMDPPYGFGTEKEAAERLLQGKNWITSDALIVIEAALETDFSWAETSGFTVHRVKKYKTNQHVFLRPDTGTEGEKGE